MDTGTAQVLLQGWSNSVESEEEEDPHQTQQLGFAAHQHMGDAADPSLGSSFEINS